MNPYEAIGRQVVGEFMNEIGDEIGVDFNWGTLVSAAAEGANQGIAYDKAKKAEAAASAASDQAATRAIAADANWASSEQQLDLAQQALAQAMQDSAKAKDPVATSSAQAAIAAANGRVAPAQALVSQAQGAAMSAGTGLPPDAQTKRVAAAAKAADSAAKAAVGDPTNGAKGALSRAWQKVMSAANAVSTPAAVSEGQALARRDGGGVSWLTAVHAGVPTYGWIIGGTAVGTALILIIRALRK